jgi:hypothetical protein
MTMPEPIEPTRIKILLEGKEYQLATFGDQMKSFDQGIKHACRMLSHYMARTNMDLLDSSMDDLMALVHEEAKEGDPDDTREP